MATLKTTQEKCRLLYSHLESELIDYSSKSKDKFGKSIYTMKCPICKEIRGQLRPQSAFLLCKKCGQKGKVNPRLGFNHSQETKEKISLSNRKRNLKNFGIERVLSSIEKKIIHTSRTRIWQALSGVNKSLSTIELIGCQPQELKSYLESLFELGMTWENYGKTGWHIDHIRPLSSFDISNPEELREACNYKNLQPLWAKDNLKKSNKYEKR